MHALSLEHQVQRMLSIIHQIPVGIIEADLLGNIKQMNAKGVQLLLPVFIQEKLSGSNILDLLKIIAPGIVNNIQAYLPPDGFIVHQKHEVIELNVSDAKQNIHYYFSVNRLSPDSFIYIFDDITEMYEKEQLLNQVIQDKAVEHSKFEMASGVLHDIGNAVVGFGSYLFKIKRSNEQHDITSLQNLKQFVEKQKPAIANAIGDSKANAIIDLLSGTIADQQAAIIDIKKSINEQMGIISHINEILNIQRQYVKGKTTDRLPVSLRNVINDSIAMLLATFNKKGIEITTDLPVHIPLVKGDRTKLMQVILNLLKNALESVALYNPVNKLVHICLAVVNKAIEITITDTGMGFAGINGDKFFEKGFTSKLEGSGLGLANCKGIVENHDGTLQLLSDGIGLGATVKIHFELQRMSEN